MMPGSGYKARDSLNCARGLECRTRRGWPNILKRDALANPDRPTYDRVMPKNNFSFEKRRKELEKKAKKEEKKKRKLEAETHPAEEGVNQEGETEAETPQP